MAWLCSHLQDNQPWFVYASILLVKIYPKPQTDAKHTGEETSMPLLYLANSTQHVRRHLDSRVGRFLLELARHCGEVSRYCILQIMLLE